MTGDLDETYLTARLGFTANNRQPNVELYLKQDQLQMFSASVASMPHASSILMRFVNHASNAPMSWWRPDMTHQSVVSRISDLAGQVYGTDFVHVFAKYLECSWLMGKSGTPYLESLAHREAFKADGRSAPRIAFDPSLSYRLKSSTKFALS
jgi:hypothetical protein